jgi:hypothetical protein
MKHSAFDSCRGALMLALAAMALASQAGCTKLLTTAMVIIKGTDTEAEFQGLKNKRVAIVCRPLVELQYSSGGVGNDIAKQMGLLISAKMRKVEIIDPDRVAEWADTHTWDDFTEIGEALDADVIIGVDLQEFKIYQSQTLYQGRAKTQIKVSDVEDNGKIIFQKHVPQIVYPPNSGVPTAEMAEEEFRRDFVAVVADQLGRYFYAYDHRADYARDVEAMKKR